MRVLHNAKNKNKHITILPHCLFRADNNCKLNKLKCGKKIQPVHQLSEYSNHIVVSKNDLFLVTTLWTTTHKIIIKNTTIYIKNKSKSLILTVRNPTFSLQV